MNSDATIYFHSDPGLQTRGFKAEYEVLFEGNLPPFSIFTFVDIMLSLFAHLSVLFTCIGAIVPDFPPDATPASLCCAKV